MEEISQNTTVEYCIVGNDRDFFVLQEITDFAKRKNIEKQKVYENFKLSLLGYYMDSHLIKH